ncbi:glutamate receptor 2-like [Petromyzon marinus]|uniref:glutamate receptor 2-like n=1 Tax=Petromyzon marinus TaxID=7757 RepID=UPI003F70C5BE
MLPPSHLGVFGLTGVRFWLLELLTSRGACGAGTPCSALNTFRALQYDAANFGRRVAHAGGACSAGAILNTSTVGLSGLIGFDREGFRRNGTLVASEMHHDGLQQVGTWSLSEDKGSRTEIKSSKFFFPRDTLYILAPEVAGFVSYGQASVSKASGFLVDLLELIAEKLEFEYQLIPYDRRQLSDVALIADIRRRLLLREVDFALFGYPITNQPEDERLALSPPILENGYHIIMKGKEVNEPRIFQFLEPLNTLLWISMLSACAGISVVLFVLSLLHPDEWYHLAKRKLVSREQGQSFNLVNSFWFVFSAMVKQGSDPLPLSMAGKIIVYTWWCFVLVVCSTYTANLAAFLTAEGQTSIRSLKDLTRQMDARYGTYSGYRIVGFLNSSARDPYMTVWRHIRDNRTMVASPKKGLEQAEKAGYIFIGEASAVFTAKKDHCDLIISDRRFFRHRLALPFPPGSRLAAEVSRAVTELEDSGQLAELERQWFAQEGQECVGLSNEHQIEMKDFKGVFYFLMMGIAAGCGVCFVECLWFKRRDEEGGAAAGAALPHDGGTITIDQLQFK